MTRSPAPAAAPPTAQRGAPAADRNVTGGGTTSGTPVDLATCNNSAGQQWKPGPNGWLINPQSGLCLDDPGSSTTDGTQLDITTCIQTSAQNWTLP